VRSLSPEEAELWSKVAATIRPLSRDVKSSEEPGVGPAANQPVEVAQLKPRAGNAGPLRQRSALPPPRSGEELKSGNTLDGSWDKRLRSGEVAPDRVVDLHGMNLDRAWRAIDDALDDAIARGERVLLLITGHHRPGEPPVERGRIRAAVHDWLAVSRHAPSIAAVRGAHRRHGGGGSLYLVLRRR